MAFDGSERVKIRFYLGWSARFHQTDSRLEQAMNAVDMDPDTEAFIRDDLLVALDDVRSKLTAAHGRLKALKVGSIDLPGQSELSALRAEGRRHVTSLAATLGVPVRKDVFGSGAGGGGYFKHG